MFGTLGAFVALWFFGVVNNGVFVSGTSILIIQMSLIALLGGISAMMIELVSPKGTDNTTVPLITTLLMLILAIALGIVSIY